MIFYIQLQRNTKQSTQQCIKIIAKTAVNFTSIGLARFNFIINQPAGWQIEKFELRSRLLFLY